MNVINNIANYLGKVTNFKSDYYVLIIQTILFILIINIIIEIFIKVYSKLSKDNKKKYAFTHKSRNIKNIFILIIAILIWEEHITSLITLISFVSAAITVAIRDIVFNYFSGIYIKIKKPFIVEDRIEVDGIIGDVININALSYEVLQISEEKGKQQSNGKIINIPNSTVFSSKIINQTKIFKYIWNEIKVNISLDSNLKKVKSILYKIVNSEDVIKRTPKRMNNLLDNDSGDYRIYYNNVEPIIYTTVIDNHIELSIRYLINPRKNRYIESSIWEKILQENKKGNINLI